MGRGRVRVQVERVTNQVRVEKALCMILRRIKMKTKEGVAYGCRQDWTDHRAQTQGVYARLGIE